LFNIESAIEDITMTMLILLPYRGLLKKKRSDGSTVRLSKDGLIRIVIPFVGSGEAIQDLTEGNPTRPRRVKKSLRPRGSEPCFPQMSPLFMAFYICFTLFCTSANMSLHYRVILFEREQLHTTKS